MVAVYFDSIRDNPVCTYNRSSSISVQITTYGSLELHSPEHSRSHDIPTFFRHTAGIAGLSSLKRLHFTNAAHEWNSSLR